jgi:O-antigen/teichoic acid export membrane protein
MFSGLAGLADFGIARAATYYLAKASTVRRSADAFYSAFFLITGISVIVAASGLVIAFFSPGWLISRSDDLRIVAIAAVAILALSLVTNLFRGFLEATFKIHVNQVLIFAFQVVNYLGAVAVSLISPNILSLTLVTVAAHLFLLLAYCITAYMAALPKLCAPSRRMTSVLLKRSVSYFALGFVNIASIPLNRLFITFWAGAGAHAIFDLALKVAMAATGLLQTLNAPLFAALARFGRSPSRQTLRLIWRMVGLSLALYLAGIISLYYLAPSISEVLVHEQRESLQINLLILVIGVGFTGVSEPVMRAFWAWGRERITAYIRLGAFIANIALLAAIGNMEPALTVALAYSTPLFLGSAVLLIQLLRESTQRHA